MSLQDLKYEYYGNFEENIPSPRRANSSTGENTSADDNDLRLNDKNNLIKLDFEKITSEVDKIKLQNKLQRDTMADITLLNSPHVLNAIKVRLPAGVTMLKEFESKFKIHAKEGYGLRKAYTTLIRQGYIALLQDRFGKEVKQRKMFSKEDIEFISAYVVPILNALSDKTCNINTLSILDKVKKDLKFSESMIAEITLKKKNAYDVHMKQNHSKPKKESNDLAKWDSISLLGMKCNESTNSGIIDSRLFSLSK
jgi:hypothetical protein